MSMCHKISKDTIKAGSFLKFVFVAILYEDRHTSHCLIAILCSFNGCFSTRFGKD